MLLNFMINEEYILSVDDFSLCLSVGGFQKHINPDFSKTGRIYFPIRNIYST